MNFKLLQEKALEKGITDIELFTKAGSEIEFRIDNGIVEQKAVTDSKAGYVRGVYNNQIVGYTTENLDDSEIDIILDYLVSSSKYVSSDEPFEIYKGDENYESFTNKKLANTPLEAKIDLGLKIVEQLKAKTKYYFRGGFAYSESRSKVTIENSKGLNLESNYESGIFLIDLNLKKDNLIKNSYKLERVLDFNDIDLDKLVDELVKEVEEQFDSSRLKSGSYKVLLERDVVSSLLNAYSHAFSSLSLKRKASFLEGKENTQVFGKNINIYDDPFLQESNSKRGFDDEGVKTRVTKVVTNGVLNTFLYNLSTAIYFNKETTGNGYKSSLGSKVGVDFDTLVLEKGNNTLEELISKTNEGIMVTSVEGLHAGINPLTGDFNLQSSGYMIKDGKKDKYVTLFVTSGNIIDLLNNVLEIGNDSKYYGSTYVPSILVKSLNISGE